MRLGGKLPEGASQRRDRHAGHGPGVHRISALNKGMHATCLPPQRRKADKSDPLPYIFFF
jgi:hypothetical protein